MPPKINIQGQRFERLAVVKEHSRNQYKNVSWECLCDCGKTTYATTHDLRSGHKKSCGCIQREKASKLRPIIHGHTVGGKNSPEYNVYRGMLRRCNNVKDKRYADWGGRGIKVCERWSDKKNGFINFLEDMGKRPSTDYSLDRKDNDKNYEPDNCQWGTDEIQNRNKRNNVWLEYGGERMIMGDWSKKLGAHPGNIKRSLKSGKPFDKIVEFYLKKKAA